MDQIKTLSMNNAYVTFINTDDYLPGVLALKKSLDRFNCENDFVILTVKKSLSNEAIKMLKSINCKLKTVGEIMNPSMNGENKGCFNHYTKLRVFEMKEYDKIIFLDADLIILEDIAPLFEAPHMSAVAAGSLIPENNWVDLNGGFLVIEPSGQLFDEMHRASGYLPSKDGTDQGFLHSFYTDWPIKKHLHLDHRFNVPLQYLETYCERFGYRFSYVNEMLDTNIAVLHYWGPLKPWMIHHESGLLDNSLRVKEAVNLWWDFYEAAFKEVK